jgi:hypothetical protein
MTSPSWPVLDNLGIDFGVKGDSNTDSMYKEEPPEKEM